MATPSTPDLLHAALAAARRDMHTAMPGQVTAVHASQHRRQFVDVRPCLKRALEDESGALIEEDLPVIPMVPVGFTQGGGFFVSLPLAVGDFVTLIFSERSIDQWIESASKSAPRTISPGDEGLQTLDGAIALPCGPAPRADLLEGVHAENLVIGLNDNEGGIEGRIHITPDGEIHLGGDDQPVALAGLVLSRLNALASAINTLKTATSAGLAGVPTAGSGLASTFNTATTAIPPTIEPVAAHKVKAAAPPDDEPS